MGLGSSSFLIGVCCFSSACLGLLVIGSAVFVGNLSFVSLVGLAGCTAGEALAGLLEVPTKSSSLLSELSNT